MKNPKILIAGLSLVCTATFLSSCKKSEINNSVPAVDKKEFAIQIAKTLYENFSNNEKILFSNAKENRLVINNLAPTCGSVTERDLTNERVLSSGALQTTKGFVRLTYLCSDNINLDSYATIDSVHTVRQHNSDYSETTIQENYTARNVGNQNISLTGKHLSHIIFKQISPAVSVNQYNDFTYNDLIVTPGGIDSGKVPFKAHGTLGGKSFDYEGYIQFTRGYQIFVSISGVSYWVDQTYWSVN